MQEERVINQVVGSIMLYDSVTKTWKTAGTSSGLSTVRILYNQPQNIFRIHGQKIGHLREVVLDCQITREVKYNRANDAFIQWNDSRGSFWGLNFRQGSPEASSFFNSVVQVLKILNGLATLPDSNGPLQVAPTSQQSNPASITQGPTMVQQQQQPIRQQSLQQPMLHQQQQQLMAQQQSQPQMLSHIPPTQLAQQQQQAQQQVTQPQQQQLHHFMQQAPPQSQQPNMNQMNHYQPQQTNHIHQPQQQMQQQQQQQHPQQQQQQQQHPQQQQQQQQQQHQPQQQMQQQQQQQPAPVSAAPIPPPPPPPPAPPMALNNCRINGTGGATNTTSSNNSNNLQHSPVTSNSFGLENGANRNGGSPSQAVSLASELAKCQLRKVNRSDSDKESECNNNSIIANAKTTRAASLAYVPDNLMNDLNKKLASRRERIDQQGDSPAASNSNSGNGVGSTNGVGGADKGQESWLADLIRKEISEQLTKMKSEIIDAIKTELRQR